MYLKSILLIALATGIASAEVLSLGTRSIPTSLAFGGTFLAGVLTTVPAGVNAVIIPRHGKKNKQGDGKKAQVAAQGTVVAAAKPAAVTGTAGGVCNGTAAAAGNAQGNSKRAYGVPMYPRHKGKDPCWIRLSSKTTIYRHQTTSYVPSTRGFLWSLVTTPILLLHWLCTLIICG